MKIVKNIVKHNFSSRNGSKIEWIVIHDTGNDKPLATAMAHFAYFSQAGRNASAHYFVDEKEIVQIIEDENSAWHVGDGKGLYGITNRNSIGIEICINDGNYTTEIARTIELTKHLMKKHNIPIQNVVRHFDASRKLCPAKLSKNNWEAWKAFKTQLQRELDKPTVDVIIKGKLHHLEGHMLNDKNYVGLRELAESLGHKVTWDNVAKVARIDE